MPRQKMLARSNPSLTAVTRAELADPTVAHDEDASRPSDWHRLYARQLHEHRTLFDAMQTLQPAIESVAQEMIQCLQRGHKILLCGNGGSACDAQHFAAEMTGRFRETRRPLAAMALTADVAVLTCIGNDFGFDDVFARQVEALAQPGDCLLGISTSGNSENVIRAVQTARLMGLTVIGLSGEGGRLQALCDQIVAIPTPSTARIQEAHVFVLHSLCVLIEAQLMGGQPMSAGKRSALYRAEGAMVTCQPIS